MKHIASFGGDSPVIVVQNKIAEHPFDLNYRGLQARYPQIRGFVKTDCKDRIGLSELRELVESVTRAMPEVRMQFPADWFAVKERLESMSNEFIGYQRFVELCAEEGVENESDRDGCDDVDAHGADRLALFRQEQVGEVSLLALVRMQSIVGAGPTPGLPQDAFANGVIRLPVLRTRDQPQFKNHRARGLIHATMSGAARASLRG
jgi:hypothetical protein